MTKRVTLKSQPASLPETQDTGPSETKREAERQRQMNEFIAQAGVKRHAPVEEPPRVRPVRERRPPRRGVRTVADIGNDLDFLALDDEKRVSIMNLRLTEREKAALVFIQQHTDHSMHWFCVDAVREALIAKVESLTKRHW
jgi:hypothetical protein